MWGIKSKCSNKAERKGIKKKICNVRALLKMEILREHFLPTLVESELEDGN